MKLVGILAASASLLIVLVGLPSQIYKNWRRKSCEGIDFRLIVTVGITYALWSLYGFTKPDWFLAISQTPGFVLSVIIALQYGVYRK